jgi:hypothetical protein
MRVPQQTGFALGEMPPLPDARSARMSELHIG